MNKTPCCTACGSPMFALANPPVTGLPSFKCPHCRRIQRAADGEDHFSPSFVEPSQP